MEIFSVPVEYSVDNIVSLNDQLAKARLRVAYTGANRNGSVIEKPAFEKAAAEKDELRVALTQWNYIKS